MRCDAVIRYADKMDCSFSLSLFHLPDYALNNQRMMSWKLRRLMKMATMMRTVTSSPPPPKHATKNATKISNNQQSTLI